MELNVYKVDGTKTRKKVTLNSDVFEIEPNDHVLYLAVKAHLANKRQGTHSVKTRSAVRGGGRKPFRQKGTGWRVRERFARHTCPAAAGLTGRIRAIITRICPKK